MTEVGGWVTGNHHARYRFGSCGDERPDVEVRIADALDNEVPAGASGEILVRPRDSFRLLLGYYNNPVATAEAMRNLWFHTGDLGRRDSDGFLYFLGRMKEIVRRGGENISPFEIETEMLRHPQVHDAAVVGVPDPIWGEEIKAVLVTEPGFDPRSLRDFLAPRIAAFMLPRYVQITDGIPRTETHKIQRRFLQENKDAVIDLLAGADHA
jgi:acyl-coenzyme A synthetase/AMP-(fatty) acid ligase